MADDAQVNDTVEGPAVLSLKEMIEAFNQQLARTSTGIFGANPADDGTLERIYIPGGVMPLQTSGAQVGVNFSMAHASTGGLLIIVQPYDNMREGDWIEVFWRGTERAVASDSVKPGQAGQLFAMYVVAAEVPGFVRPASEPTPEQITGVVSDLWFRVTRAGSGNRENSKRLGVLSRLVFPGGNDSEPDRPGHYNLLPPVAAVPASGVIGETEANAGVKVTIEAYPHMRAYDSIRLSWGGVFVDRQVQPAEVGKPVVITVSREIIVAAGDSDSLVLTYRLVDEVQNQSSDWSLRGFVEVALEQGLFPAPFIINPDENADPADVIDLVKLNDADLEIEVDTANKDPVFLLNDVVLLTWTGTTAAGQTINFQPPSQRITRVGRTLTFLVPNEYLIALGMGRGVVSYQVSRANTQFRSKRSFASFIGQARLLLRPELLEAIDDMVEIDVPTATVSIPQATGLLANDTLILTWLGTRADGTPLLYTERRRISAGQAGKEYRFRVDPAVNLVPLDGGTLLLSYQLLRRGLDVPLDSASTLIGVGVALSELPAPSTVPVFTDGNISPGDHPNGIEVVIQPYPNMNANQTIYLSWVGDVGDPFHDNVDAEPGFPTYFSIDQAQLRKNENGEVRVFYTVSEPDKPDRLSDDLVLYIGVRQSRDLPPPLVLEAPGAPEEALDPANAPNGATVRVPATANLQLGDLLIVHWSGDQGDASKTEVEWTVLQGEQGLHKDLVIDSTVVRASNNGNVNLQYEVYRAATGLPDNSAPLTLRVQGAALPLPTFVEAVNGNLNPDDVPDGATVLIDASARLRVNDLVTVSIAYPGGAKTFLKTVQVGGAALRVTVPAADVQALANQTVTLTYTVFRSPNGPSEPSGASTFTINRVIGAGTLRIFGARYNASTYRASGASRVISAFNARTLRPILAQWRYDGDTNWQAGTTWLDREPWRLLRVRSTTDAVVLNPTNVVGTGNDAVVNGTAAFASMIENNPVTPGRYQLVTWGMTGWGGRGPGITLNDVMEVSATRSACAARLSNGNLVCWGGAAEGATLRPEDVGQPFLDVRSNSTVFIGRRQVAAGSKLGRLTGWGVLANGADIPANLRALTDIVEVYGAGTAFTAKRSNNTLIAWGQAGNGGSVPAVIANRTDNIYVKGNFAAFVVRRTDMTVAAWGNGTYGGAPGQAITGRNDIASLEGATAQAFSVLTSSGQVLAWGAASHGGSVPANIAALSDIVEVTSTWHAFCARLRNGRVVAWGNATNGGTLPASIAALTDIVQVTGSAWTFAALRSNGQVVVWGGTAASGLNIAPVQAQLTNVRAIYANSNGFTALTSDGRVVTWGTASGGGDSSTVQALLRGRLLTGRTDTTPGAVVAPDNELRGSV
ncbi:hypothetical protein [Pseudomonas sp. MWU13-3659]|uniref:RCC1 domain-containing protein n=1 Tax=Pseudomonas sp. MWU13-3659 TaxID=2986964 RepID=UPI0020750DAC|nr:hypothetical protein [Pseudomonas sp. MWU13-3659]